MRPLSIVTPSNFVIQELDQPYDSVTQEGGGANLIWNIPAAFLDHSSYDSGYLVCDPLGDPTDSIQVPLPSLPARSSTYGAILEELTTLTPDTTYSVAMTLNFTENSVPVAATSNPLSFTYLKDTSGDGLSDAEKALGWTVTPTDINGNSVNEQVTADVNSYATNGLVNDLIEKKFGLDPRTLDTAGSHMLDTWNLTFQLPSANCPSGFECWDESSNGAFNPFTVSEFPGATAPCTVGSPPPGWTSQCAPSGTAPGNFSQGSVGFTGPDSSPWGSNQLWSYSDLQVLQGLIPSSDGYLRGVLLDASGVGPSITVWGKLSWGANPLAASTPSDGTADGARVNPLYEEALQLQFTNPLGGGGGAFLTYKGTEIQDCNGFAVRYWANDSSGTPEYQAYTSAAFAQVTATPKACPNGPFAVLGTSAAPQTYTLPIPQTSQVQHLDLQMLVNLATDTSSFKLEQIPIYGCSLSYGLSVDMVAPPSEDSSSNILAYALQGGSQSPPSASGCPREPQTNGFLDFGVTAVPSGVKAPTYLWVPSDNSTLSPLPMGLQRYTGEQNFVVVAADVHFVGNYLRGPVTSDPVTYPWGDSSYLSSYQVTLQPGLNNFLIPRSQFLASPLGAAILQNQLVSSNANTITGPLAYGSTTNLLSAGEGGSVLTGNNLQALGCYWQNRAVSAPGPTGTISQCGTEDGTYDPSAGYGFYQFQEVNVTYNDAEGSCSGINCGGVPSNPNVVPSQFQAPAVQSVITVHLTCSAATTYGCDNRNVDSPELDALLAGLLYNAQGGSTGYFADITREVPSLGLLPAVTEALANAAQVSQGVFGEPISLAQPPPPSPPSCSGFSCVWNTVSGALLELGETIANGLVGLAGTIWNAASAAANYFVNAVPGLHALLETAAAAVASALKTVGAAIAKALADLLAFVTAAIKAILAEVIDPILSAIASAVASQETSLLNAASAASDLATNDPTSPNQVANALGRASGPEFIIAGGIAAIIDIVLGVADEADVPAEEVGATAESSIFDNLGRSPVPIPSVSSSFAGAALPLTFAAGVAMTAFVEGLINGTVAFMGAGAGPAGITLYNLPDTSNNDLEGAIIFSIVVWALATLRVLVLLNGGLSEAAKFLGSAGLLLGVISLIVHFAGNGVLHINPGCADAQSKLNWDLSVMLSLVSLALSGVGGIVAIMALASPSPANPGPIALVSLIMGGVGLATSAFTLGADLGECTP
ncbi:MAG: hypothetical protein KGI89_12090 [Euryarchaeota archaeon]|nr:hypothetical protein [Euryarchaeota archaeon]